MHMILKKINPRLLGYRQVLLVFVIFSGIIFTISIIGSIVRKIPFLEFLYRAFLNVISGGWTSLPDGWGVDNLTRTVLFILGLVFTAIVLTSVSGYFLNKYLRRIMGTTLPKIEGHTIICGFNDSARVIIEKMQEENENIQIVIIANRESSPYDKPGVYWIKGDFTAEEALERAHIKFCKTAIVLSDILESENSEEFADARTIMSVLAIEKLNHECHTAAELFFHKNSKHLQNADVDEIIVANEMAGMILSRVSQNSGISRVIKMLLDVSEGVEVYKITCPEHLKAMTFKDALIEVYEKYGYILLAAENGNKDLIASTNRSENLLGTMFLYLISDATPIM